MRRRIPLNLAGAILAPAVLVAFVLGLAVAGVLNCGSRPAVAQTGEASAEVLVPSVSGDQGPFVAVAEAVIPCVVNISAEKTVKLERRITPQYEGPFEEFFRDFFRQFPEMPLEQERRSLGSGVVVRSDGYILTNNHVVRGFEDGDVVVKFSDGTEFKGKQVKIVGQDSKTDLAMLKVDSKQPLAAIRFGKAEEIKVGAWAIAVGNPFGLQSTVTVGVISAKGRSGIPLPEGPSYQDFIQTDASINPGNSGGPLVNSKGELIGVNTAIRSPVGANVGVGFAVPVDMVETVTGQLIEHGRVIRGFLGVRPQEVTESIRKALDLKQAKGVLVAEVVKDMPAEKAGIKDGDLIVRVNETEVEGVEHFRRLVADFPPGTSVSLDLVRDKQRLTKRVKLVEFPEEEVAAAAEEKTEPELGLSVRSLTRAEQEQHEVDGGVAVESVEPGSAGDHAGIQRGDIILEIGGTGIDGIADYNEAVARLARAGEPVLVRVKRGDIKLYLAVEPEE